MKPCLGRLKSSTQQRWEQADAFEAARDKICAYALEGPSAPRLKESGSLSLAGEDLAFSTLSRPYTP